MHRGCLEEDGEVLTCSGEWRERADERGTGLLSSPSAGSWSTCQQVGASGCTGTRVFVSHSFPTPQTSCPPQRERIRLEQDSIVATVLRI